MKVEVIFTWAETWEEPEATGIRLGPFDFVSFIGSDLRTEKGLIAVRVGDLWHVEGYEHTYSTVRIWPIEKEEA